MSADTRKKIYDILKNKTGFMDSYEDFDNDMTTSEDAVSYTHLTLPTTPYV